MFYKQKYSYLTLDVDYFHDTIVIHSNENIKEGITVALTNWSLLKQ
jgi:hypothetical protein